MDNDSTSESINPVDPHQGVDPLVAIVNAGRKRLVHIDRWWDTDQESEDEPWGSFAVEPPTVRQVLTVIACGRERDEELFWECVEDWLPEDLVKHLKHPEHGVTFEFALKVAGQCIQDGAVEIPKTDTSDIENPSDWQDLFADYGHAYSKGFDEIMDETWPGFVLMSQKIAQVHARDQYRSIEAANLPHIRDDADRHQAYESLRSKAKLPRLTEEAELRLKLKKQRENLDKLKDSLPSVKGYRQNGNGAAQ